MPREASSLEQQRADVWGKPKNFDRVLRGGTTQWCVIVERRRNASVHVWLGPHREREFFRLAAPILAGTDVPDLDRVRVRGLSCTWCMSFLDRKSQLVLVHYTRVTPGSPRRYLARLVFGFALQREIVVKGEGRIPVLASLPPDLQSPRMAVDLESAARAMVEISRGVRLGTARRGQARVLVVAVDVQGHRCTPERVSTRARKKAIVRKKPKSA